MPSHNEILGSLNVILCDAELSIADCFNILAHLVAAGIVTASDDHVGQTIEFVKLVNSWVDAEAKASKTKRFSALGRESQLIHRALPDD
jgi:hypothetical protein